MTDSLKILPAVMISAFLLLVLKSFAVWSGIQNELAGVSTAIAAEETEAAEDVVAEKASAKENPSDIKNKSAEEATPTMRTAGFMSQTEIDVLQSLAARRDALDRRVKEIELREKLLQATEQRVDGKIAELKGIEGRISDMLALREDEQEAQLVSLVKVYETMKAKDAARIFEQLDSDILLDVADRMKEQKMAAILASMNPASAQDLTVMLANRHKLPEKDPAQMEAEAEAENG